MAEASAAMLPRREYRVISVDDHLVEPPDVWTKRVTASKRDDVPHIESINGRQTWVVGTKQVAGVSSCAGVDWHDYRRDGVSDSYDTMRPGGYDPKERLRDYDLDGVDAGVLFPGFARFAGDPLNAVEDLSLRLRCIEAYNDWLAEEFCAVAPDRLIAQCLIPPWDVALATKEASRCIEKGHRAVIFGAAMDTCGYRPTFDRYWDPLWSVLQDAGVPVAFHQPSATMDRPTIADPAHPIPQLVRPAVSLAHMCSLVVPMGEILMSGMMQRFPRLRVFFAESGVGWMPYVLQQADYVWERYRYWADPDNAIELRPSEYFRRQCWCGFWSEEVNPYMLAILGEDNVMWEGDYPHSILTWPDSRRHQEDSLRSIEDEVVRAKILAGNAVRLFNL